MTTEREKFEAWMKTRYKPGCAMLGKDADGDYTNVYTMMEWAGWKARADMLAADGAQSEPTDAEITELAHRQCMNYKHSTHENLVCYSFNPTTMIDFARKLLAKGGAK